MASSEWDRAPAGGCQRTFGTAMGNVRWDRVAEGLGCEGLFVDTRDALAPAIERAHKSAAPTVLCIKTDRDASVAVPGEPGVGLGSETGDA